MSIEIVIGPMFSGKSTYALSYIRRQQSIGKQVLVMKPNIDTRYSKDNVLVTHNYEQTSCMVWPISDLLNPIIPEIRQADSIVLEEAQFFVGLKNFVSYVLRVYKKTVLVVGLDGDANQKPFGEVLDCIPWASSVTKLNALCRHCRNGTIAPYTKRIQDDTSVQVDVGGSDKYESVCLKHLVDTS